MTYKVGSMFAGIGGICLGFKRNNCEIVWANEIDKYACYTYRHNFNGAKYLIEGDIRDITHAKKINKKIKERRKLIKIKRIESEEDLLKRIDKEIPDIDILNGGFPCQAFSIAGERKGFEDERGNMFFEIEKVLKAKRPQAFLLENVKNLKTHDNGRTFKIIEQHLKNLGYTIKSEVLNSMTHGNVPQNRERIFIVGFLNEDIAENFSFPEAIELNRNIGDIINLNEKKNDKYYYNKTKYYKDLVVEMTRQDTLYQIRRGMYIRENRNNV
ncbi:DNA (cytosine-5-)-methyltransferase, partial [Clostridioides difficile]|nr:DNA (cytosine-5-)-methyltransferase [Clostridioides difficile]